MNYFSFRDKEKYSQESFIEKDSLEVSGLSGLPSSLLSKSSRQSILPSSDIFINPRLEVNVNNESPPSLSLNTSSSENNKSIGTLTYAEKKHRYYFGEERNLANSSQPPFSPNHSSLSPSSHSPPISPSSHPPPLSPVHIIKSNPSPYSPPPRKVFRSTGRQNLPYNTPQSNMKSLDMSLESHYDVPRTSETTYDTLRAGPPLPVKRRYKQRVKL